MFYGGVANNVVDLCQGITVEEPQVITNLVDNFFLRTFDWSFLFHAREYTLIQWDVKQNLIMMSAVVVAVAGKVCVGQRESRHWFRARDGN